MVDTHVVKILYCIINFTVNNVALFKLFIEACNVRGDVILTPQLSSYNGVFIIL